MENIKQIKIDELKDSEYNPRQITKDELKKLKTSIEKSGLVQPIVVNINPERENVVISGHQRLKAAKSLGLKEVPCMLVDLSLTKEKALNLAMNRIGGRFEEEKLIDLLSAIEQENEDILNITGFDNAEINYLLGLREKEKEQIYADTAEDDFDLTNKYEIKEGDLVFSK
jgi:ParB-like chromosome segregation protein Spo0J